MLHVSKQGSSQLAAAWRRVERQAKCFQRLSEGGFSEMSTVYFVEDDEGARAWYFGLGAQGLGFRVKGFRVWGFTGLGFRVLGLGV